MTKEAKEIADQAHEVWLHNIDISNEAAANIIIKLKELKLKEREIINEENLTKVIKDFLHEVVLANTEK